MLGCSLKARVTVREKASRSTARLVPAGTRLASAHFRIRESILFNSALRIPVAELGSSLLKEFEQTISAAWSVVWAGVLQWGLISLIRTL